MLWHEAGQHSLEKDLVNRVKAGPLQLVYFLRSVGNGSQLVLGFWALMPMSCSCRLWWLGCVRVVEAIESVCVRVCVCVCACVGSHSVPMNLDASCRTEDCNFGVQPFQANRIVLGRDWRFGSSGQF